MDQPKPNAPLWLKVFIGFHLLATLCWGMPNSAPAVRNGLLPPKGLDWIPYFNDTYLRPSPIQQYIQSLGMWQSWDMFAPNPSNRDIWCDAIVQHESGKEAIYQYPRVHLQSYPWKYVRERYRKFYERANLDQFSFMWVPFSQHIARVSHTDPGDPPVRVILRRHYILIPPAKPFRLYVSDLWGALASGRSTAGLWLPPAPHIDDFVTSPYFAYEVSADDLAQ